MTVKELIECLNILPQELPVYATWEGVYIALKKERIKLSSRSESDELDTDALILFVDIV